MRIHNPVRIRAVTAISILRTVRIYFVRIWIKVGTWVSSAASTPLFRNFLRFLAAMRRLQSSKKSLITLKVILFLYFLRFWQKFGCLVPEF